jgi:hypothetical protein
MTIQEFIEAAIEGKYHISGMPFENEDNKITSTKIENEATILLINYEWNNEGTIQYPVTTIPINKDLINEMVLDPKAWEAVGKVKDWQNLRTGSSLIQPYRHYKDIMHEMIDALNAGRTIEEYIATL